MIKHEVRVHHLSGELLADRKIEMAVTSGLEPIERHEFPLVAEFGELALTLGSGFQAGRPPNARHLLSAYTFSVSCPNALQTRVSKREVV